MRRRLGLDGLLRDVPGAGIEVAMEALSGEGQATLRGQKVGNTGKTPGQLEAEYGGRGLKIFRDAHHRLYVQRPPLEPYE